MNVRQSADTTHTAVCSSKADRSGIVTQITATMQGDRKQLHFSFHSAVHKATHFHSDINAHPVPPPRLPPAHPPAVLSFTFFFFVVFVLVLSRRTPLCSPFSSLSTPGHLVSRTILSFLPSSPPLPVSTPLRCWFSLSQQTHPCAQKRRGRAGRLSITRCERMRRASFLSNTLCRVCERRGEGRTADRERNKEPLFISPPLCVCVCITWNTASTVEEIFKSLHSCKIIFGSREIGYTCVFMHK